MSLSAVAMRWVLYGSLSRGISTAKGRVVPKAPRRAFHSIAVRFTCGVACCADLWTIKALLTAAANWSGRRDPGCDIHRAC